MSEHFGKGLLPSLVAWRIGLWRARGRPLQDWEGTVQTRQQYIFLAYNGPVWGGAFCDDVAYPTIDGESCFSWH